MPEKAPVVVSYKCSVKLWPSWRHPIRRIRAKRRFRAHQRAWSHLGGAVAPWIKEAIDRQFEEEVILGSERKSSAIPARRYGHNSNHERH